MTEAGNSVPAKNEFICFVRIRFIMDVTGVPRRDLGCDAM
jgi:hypothetical protein